MSNRKVHLVICFIALAAYLLNMAAATGGVVLCQETAGDTSIELAFDSDHCAPIGDAEHNHESGGCWCSACPCEDTSLSIDITPVLRDDDVLQNTSNSITFLLVQQAEIEKQSTIRFLLREHPTPTFNRSLRQLQTVVLIV